VGSLAERPSSCGCRDIFLAPCSAKWLRGPGSEIRQSQSVLDEAQLVWALGASEQLQFWEFQGRLRQCQCARRLSLQAPDLQDPVSTVPPEAPFSPELHDSRRSGSATPSPDVGSRVLRFYRLKCLELESQVHERDAEVTRLRQALTEATGDTTSPSSPVSESSQVMTGSLVAD